MTVIKDEHNAEIGHYTRTRIKLKQILWFFFVLFTKVREKMLCSGYAGFYCQYTIFPISRKAAKRNSMEGMEHDALNGYLE